uniref:Uncharacterized protein n=1 Tax=Arundo donax TaxID=35708 RepID=A0A0A9GMF7_ARUDO
MVNTMKTTEWQGTKPVPLEGLLKGSLLILLWVLMLQCVLSCLVRMSYMLLWS